MNGECPWNCCILYASNSCGPPLKTSGYIPYKSPILLVLEAAGYSHGEKTKKLAQKPSQQAVPPVQLTPHALCFGSNSRPVSHCPILRALLA